LYIIYTNLTKK